MITGRLVYSVLYMLVCQTENDAGVLFPSTKLHGCKPGTILEIGQRVSQLPLNVTPQHIF